MTNWLQNRDNIPIASYWLVDIIGDDRRLYETGIQEIIMNNRRRYDRKLLTFFSSVIDRTNGRLLGYLVDMTTGGALMKGNFPLKVNAVFQLRIDLPENFAEKEFIEIQAKAVWSIPDIDPEFYRTGLQLINIDPRDLLILERLIADYGLNVMH